MRDDEKRAFIAMMQGVAAYYDRKLALDTIGIYWRGLADLPFDAVRAALDAHVQDPQSGQFMPKIADIRRAIESGRDDGHPGPDEAWSIALQARHESSSVVWTEQISSAFFTAALPLLDEGDKIAARRAFIERYERELTEARRAGVVAKWVASLGSDPTYRVQAVENAVRAGRIMREHATALLPSPDATPSREAVRLLESGVEKTAADPAEAKRQLAALRLMLGVR